MMMLRTANMCFLLPGMLAFHTHINLFNPLNALWYEHCYDFSDFAAEERKVK